MRVLFALPGLHRYNRGAEIAFISVARELAKAGETVTLIGSGPERVGAPYRYLRAASIARERFERFPWFPPLRSEYAYEELTFVPGLLRRYRPADYDITLTCGYPFTNWLLRRPVWRGSRPAHVFVTQNGDWPAYARNSEYRYFGCDGLVCTNPDFLERNRNRWRCALIPNGVDCDRFRPGSPQRQAFGLPANRLIVLMVSALIASKRIAAGIAAVSRLPEAHLVVAGDGPLRGEIDALAAELLAGRYLRMTVAPEQMPALYQSADVFLHMSKDEAFGNIYLEALACGLPVVGHDSPRLRWIVGDDEFLVDTDEEAAVAEAIRRARDTAPERRQHRLAKAAAFSWSKIGEMYRRFLDDIVGSSSNVRHSKNEQT
jgi:glycosyltransferase involved in cell wall biosynthesis